MKKKVALDAFDMLSNFQTTILNKKPNLQNMFDEVRMMKFRIRPVHGDISILNLKDTQFIELLWSLGKLDEFYQTNVDKISPKQRNTFYRLFDEMQQKFQDELNTLNLKQETPDPSAGFEMEIYKEKAKKNN